MYSFIAAISSTWTHSICTRRGNAAFTKQASEELRIKEETLRRDLGRVLLQLEKLQDEQIRQTLTPEKPAARRAIWKRRWRWWCSRHRQQGKAG